MGHKFACLSLSCLLLITCSNWVQAQRPGERRKEHGSKGDYAKALELREPQEALRTEGGSLNIWSENLRALRDVDIGVAEIDLKEDGLLVPQYADAATIFYVMEGSGVVGISHPLQGEFRRKNVRRVEKGDVFAVEAGVVFWLYNDGKERYRIFCVSDVSKGSNRGLYNPFPLAGARKEEFGSFLHGFSTKVLADAWNVDEKTVKELIESQQEASIVRAPRRIRFPEGREEDFDQRNLQGEAEVSEAASAGGFVYPSGRMYPDLLVKNGGWLKTINRLKLPVLRNIGLSAIKGRLEREAIMAPGWFLNAHHIIRVTRGSGRIEVVSNDGERVLDTEVKEGSVIVVPRFFPATKIAGPDGLEWISILTNDRPVASFLAGANSAYKGIPEEVVAAAFGVDRKTERQVRESRRRYEVILPPGGESKRQGGGGGPASSVNGKAEESVITRVIESWIGDHVGDVKQLLFGGDEKAARIN